MNKQWSIRDFKKLLKNNNYVPLRQSGSHQVWSDGKNSIVLPTVKLNKMLAKRLIKENKLQLI